MRTLFHRLKGWRDTSGTSAVEFGLIAPILILLTIALYDLNDMSYRTSNMQTAIRAGIQYTMNGGEDLDQAKSIANSAWSRKPADGVLNASETCKCAGNTQACNSTCGVTMNKWITITASGTIGGNYYSTFQTKTETVRIR
jgi:Flp pilus assembly protein TadG